MMIRKMNHGKQTIVVVAFVMCLGLFAGQTMAQSSTTGSIEGTVSDPNGAAVRGATVTATSPNLISAQTATTADNGQFQISNLPPGTYEVDWHIRFLVLAEARRVDSHLVSARRKLEI